MRGDLALHLRLALRPRGLVGVVAVVAGASGIAAAFMPWYVVAAELDALGHTRSWPVAQLAGWSAHPWTWLVPVAALAAVAVGVGLAVDRPMPRSRNLHLLAGLVTAGTVSAAGLLFPPVSQFDVEGSRLRELMRLAEGVPSDVNMAFSVQPGVGLWLTLGAAALLVATAFAAREVR